MHDKAVSFTDVNSIKYALLVKRKFDNPRKTQNSLIRSSLMFSCEEIFVYATKDSFQIAVRIITSDDDKVLLKVTNDM